MKLKKNPIWEEIKNATSVLKTGGVILYPTDTIWGIGCNAQDAQAVEKVFEIKKRDTNKSLIVLLSDTDELFDYVEKVPPFIFELLKNKKKPLTIIYEKAKNLAANIIASDGSIAIRIPDNDFCKELIKTTKFPIVSTSANFSGTPSSDSFFDIPDEIKRQVDYIVNLNQNKTEKSTASTIIKITGNDDYIVIRDRIKG